MVVGSGVPPDGSAGWLGTAAYPCGTMDAVLGWAMGMATNSAANVMVSMAKLVVDSRRYGIREEKYGTAR